MTGKTLREKIIKSVQRTLGFCLIHENFLKSLGYISSRNVSYCKLKLNNFSLMLLFVEFSQFLSEATKVSNKIKAVELTSMKTSSTQDNILPGHIGHHWIIFCLHFQCLSKSIKSLDYRLCWFIVLITFKFFLSWLAPKCQRLLEEVTNLLMKFTSANLDDHHINPQKAANDAMLTFIPFGKSL